MHFSLLKSLGLDKLLTVFEAWNSRAKVIQNLLSLPKNKYTFSTIKNKYDSMEILFGHCQTIFVNFFKYYDKIFKNYIGDNFTMFDVDIHFYGYTIQILHNKIYLLTEIFTFYSIVLK